MSSEHDDLDTLRAALSTEEWQRRLEDAERQAAVLERVLIRNRAGESLRAAIRAEAPEDPETTWVARMRRYRDGGREGLIRRSQPVRPPDPLVTAEVRAMVRGLLKANPTLRSGQVREELRALGHELGETTVRHLMAALGLAQPEGRPPGRRKVEPLLLAGAELLCAVDLELGAVQVLTEDLERALGALPEPASPVRDDRANRDDHGRFLPAYNQPAPRTEPELGEKFDSVKQRRVGKDLPSMRTANSSTASLHRKVMSMVLLPCLTDSPRWEALRHWQGEALGGLVGIPYQPATLDKFLRELKFGGLSEAARESVARFWLERPDLLGEGPLAGAAVVYVDTSVKPVWTHHFSRCAKLSKLGGRVMPATSTAFLHAGHGTPVVYRSFSGHASLPSEIGDLLRSYEAVAGKQTARRLVVIDREGHAVWMLRELQKEDWDFIVPLRSNVVGPKARFEEMTEWVPYGDKGDEMRGGWLWLNNSKDRKEPLRVRVVARKRRRTGKVAWYATLAPAVEVPDPIVLDLYFARWPLQELVFKDGAGRVHLDVHHGYSRQKVDNVAVLDVLDKLEGQARALQTQVEQGQAQIELLQQTAAEQAAVVERASARLVALHAEMDAEMAAGRAGTAAFSERYAAARTIETWLGPVREAAAAAAQAADKVATATAYALDKLHHIAGEKERLASQRRIFTIDTELDEVLTAFKLTFINLAHVLMGRYLGGTPLQLDTLIRGILTLPGERELTPKTETIRIWRPHRDPEMAARVETACQRLSERGLVRGKRRLRFEVADGPAP